MRYFSINHNKDDTFVTCDKKVHFRDSFQKADCFTDQRLSNKFLGTCRTAFCRPFRLETSSVVASPNEPHLCMPSPSHALMILGSSSLWIIADSYTIRPPSSQVTNYWSEI